MAKERDKSVLIPEDWIPVNSVEGHAIITKVFNKALEVFEKHNVNMPLGYQGKENWGWSRWQS